MTTPERSELNLIHDSWLPVRRSSGREEWIRPAAITKRINSDPVMAFGWNRPDLDAAAHEFLIGLLSTAVAPASDAAWRDLWEAPPEPEDLDKAFGRVAGRFHLNGAGVRFMQDLEPFEDADERNKPMRSASALLLNAPGNQTLLKRTDIFVRGDTDGVYSLPAAAIALYTHQLFASSAGVGYRTSIRGGGPLTTRVVASATGADEPTLWEQVWANVETADESGSRGPDRREAGAIFPWEAHTRLSDKKQDQPDISQNDVNPLLVYWAMPRRVRLRFAEGKGRACSLTGRKDPVVVEGFFARNYGSNYLSGQFNHPLSPYYLSAQKEMLPLHPQPDGLTPRAWLSICVPAEDGSRRVAQSVGSWARKGGRVPGRYRILASGYDMDSAKARSWYELEMPLWNFKNEASRKAFNAICPQWTDSVRQVAGTLIRAIKWSRFKDSRKKIDYGHLAVELMHRLAPAFYATVDELGEALSQTPKANIASIRWNWSQALIAEGKRIFERELPWNQPADRRSYVEARYRLWQALDGRGKEGNNLYKALGIDPPDPGVYSERQYMRDTDAEAVAKTCVKWWAGISRVTGREVRSAVALRRANKLSIVEQFPEVLQLMTLCSDWNREQLLVVAGVLAGVRKYEQGKTVAQQIGQGSLRSKNNRASLPERALRTLINTPSKGLLKPMQHIVRLTRRQLNVFDMAYAILTWDRERTRQQWLYDYYGVYAVCMPMNQSQPDAHGRERVTNEEIKNG